MGHVTGICQSSDRAELTAVLSAIQWQCCFGTHMHLWIDSKFVADNLTLLLQSGVIGDWSHQDLWDKIDQSLQQRGQFELYPHWIPSHLDEHKLQDPFEDWVKCWNDRVDMAIGRYNQNRHPDLLRLKRDFEKHYELGVERLRQLRSFYFQLAAKSPEMTSEPAEGAEVSLFGFVDELQPSFGDICTDEAMALVSNSARKPRDLPAQFIFALINHLRSCVVEDVGVYPLCFEEMTFWLIKDFHLAFPFCNTGTGEFELHLIESRFERPTFAYVLRLVRRAVCWFFTECCDGDHVLFSNFSKVDLGVYRPTSGVYIRLQLGALARCQALLRQFTSSRAIRRACDIARPFH